MTSRRARAAARVEAWSDWLAHRGLFGLFVVSMMEATILPLPLEPFLVPIMLARPGRALIVAAVALAGCVAGAALFYVLAVGIAEQIEPWLIRIGLEGMFNDIRRQLEEETAFVALFLVGLTPVPFQLGPLAAGAVGVNIALTLVALGVGRGIRYFGMALLALLVGKWWARRRARREGEG